MASGTIYPLAGKQGMSGVSLEAIDLVKTYGSIQALRGVTFSVAPGEMFGMLGPNGAGKTTLLSILSLLLDPTSGTASLDGRRLSGSDRELKRWIGIVPQELAIYGELTARENLCFFGKLYGVAGAKLADRVARVLQAIGLEDRADKRASTFSGGMKRRLNLGVALVHEPRILFLDEPTTGVDPQSRNHLFEEIRRVNREGTTVIYTSHYMEEVQALCTRVGILDHGELIACDTLPDMLRQLDGLIRIHVPQVPGTLVNHLEAIDGVKVNGRSDESIEVTCKNVKKTLGQILSALNDLHLELLGVETEEPNLERVFLHLTGRALRD
ncbi:MAG: ABC transporter ATP-binding protein [Planctomycetota bacterium]